MPGYLGKKATEHSKQGSQDIWKGTYYGREVGDKYPDLTPPQVSKLPEPPIGKTQ